MPSLSWIGKEKVQTHHFDVPFKELNLVYGYRSEKPNDKTATQSGNIVVHGDNLLALKALLPKYEGRVNCIYIDPPYNTGKEKWVYNDNVKDPRIQKWLGQVVGEPSEDFSRDDKWLCMMYPRLVLLRELLASDGAIFISIDDNELASLKLICDEIFGAHNFVGQWHWFKSATPPNLSHKIKKNIEYVLCYEKHKSSKKYVGVQKYSSSDDPITKPQNTIKELEFREGSIHFKGKDGVISPGVYGTKKYPNELLNEMIIKEGVNQNKVTFRNRFIWQQTKLDFELDSNTVINCSKQLVLSYKKANYDPEVPPNLIDDSVGVSTTEEAGKFLHRLFGKDVFEFPKDVSLIKYLIGFLNNKDAIVLDSFAGSGTTGQAVWEMNKEDQGNRKFILIELNDYAETITAERLRRVAIGVKSENIEGIGGEFDFYELGQSLFDEHNNLNEKVDEEHIREYIYYSETKQPLSRKRSPAFKYLLDTYDSTGYYFYYEKNQLTELSLDTLSIIGEKADSYIVYADICTLSKEMLLRYNIEFKKIPRDIKRF